MKRSLQSLSSVKKIVLLFLLPLMSAAVANAQYFYLTGSGKNPGELNIDAEYPDGGGLPTGWTKIDAGSAATPLWTPAQTIPFSFMFNGSPVTQFKVSTSGVLTFDMATTKAAPIYTRGPLPNA